MSIETVKLVMRPQDEPKSWRDFCQESEPFSMALDGYVSTGPRFQKSGPRANFNHHEDVDRLSTRSTCAQVLIAIRQGLFKCFCDNGLPKINAYFNDCDEDVCISWFLLKYGYLAEHTMNPILNRLVNMEDMLDTTAGAYPFPSELPSLQELAWVFQPYRNARVNGLLEGRKEDTFVGIVTDVEHRIMKHIAGQGESIPLEFIYKNIGGGPGWAMVEEIGAHARTSMFADGIRAFVAVKQRDDGNWNYVLGRMSPFIPFDIPRYLRMFNRVENINTNDLWGGGNTIGGSPRISGSKLTPTIVQQMINEDLEKSNVTV